MASVVVAPRAGSQIARKGSPLVLLVAGLLIALIVLPSALNLPQTNPSPTLEYAPVPPTDEDTPPPVGNFDNFGLGDSSSIGTDGALGGGGGGSSAPGTNKGQKRCVQTPKGIKQTEDPLAPPCQATYPDCTKNGGATYQGVTGQEIKILFYFDSNITDVGTSRGDEARPTNEYFDLAGEEQPDEHVYVRLLRGWQKYFFDRYQTYCRVPHFYVYFGSSSTAGPEAKRGDAADNYDRIKPFAVVSDSLSSNDAYLEAMARRGVLQFGSFLGRENSFYSRFPKLVWNYAPTLELQAEQYVDFFCKQIKPYKKTTFAGGNLVGKDRRYGLVYSDDPNHPELRKLQKIVMDGIKAKCPITQPGGIPIATWKPCCYADDNATLPGYAVDGMSKFSDPNQAGGPVTTIIWPGGIESKFGEQAANRQYFPEWIQLGDAQIDGFVGQQYQNQQAFNRHAVVVSWQTKTIDLEQEPCFLAYKDADPAAPDADVRGRACSLYQRLRQLFTGIQVAGPRLGPTSIDKGYHAIPRIASESPDTPACFYNLNDYTCVKDGITMWWDAFAKAPNNADPGCWKMVNNAQRYLIGEFPAKEYWSTVSGADQCNGYGGRALTSLSPV